MMEGPLTCVYMNFVRGFQKLKEAEQTLKDQVESYSRELDTWKSNCEKLTAAVSRKELELQAQQKKVNEIEEQVGPCRLATSREWK